MTLHITGEDLVLLAMMGAWCVICVGADIYYTHKKGGKK